MSKPKLTAKQELFCKEYIVDLNAKQAAVRAGYSEKTAQMQGCRLLTNDKVQDKIQNLMTKRSKKVEISSDWVLNKLQSVAVRCMQEERVLVKGVPTGEFKFDSAGANRSLELIGKHLMLFTDKIDHSSYDGSMSPDSLSTEERQARIQELLARKK